jgi:hypothetical protein
VIFGWGVSGGDSIEVADDGTWTILVTSGEGLAGRCGARLSEGEISNLRSLVDVAAAAGPPVRPDDMPWKAGAAVETIYAAETVGQAEWGAPWPPEWRALSSWAQDLLAGSAEHPVACVALDLAGDGAMRQAGTEPVETDGSAFAVHAYESAADGAIGNTWETTVPGPDGGVLPVGWKRPLGLSSAGLTAPANGTIEVSVSFTLIDPPPQAISVWASIPATHPGEPK